MFFVRNRSFEKNKYVCIYFFNVRIINRIDIKILYKKKKRNLDIAA